MGYADIADIDGTDNGLTTEAKNFLANAGEEDLLRFFKFLPIVGGHFSEPVTVADLVYEMLLWPYVKKAVKAIKGDMGVPARIRMISDIMRMSEEALEADTGYRRRVPRAINLPAFLTQYFGEGLSI